MKDFISAAPVSVIFRVPKPILMKDKLTLRFDLLVLEERTEAILLASRGWRYSKGTLTPPATKVKAFFYPVATLDESYQKMIEDGIAGTWRAAFPTVTWEKPQVPIFSATPDEAVASNI